MEVWIGRDGERHGPYNEADVRQWLRSGQVSGEDLGWYEGLADWQPLATLFPADVGQATTPPPFAQPAATPLPRTNAASLEDYAGFWRRVVAYILDGIVLYIPSMLIEKLFHGDAAKAVLEKAALSAAGDPQLLLAAQHQYYATMWPAMVLGLAIAWIYFAVCESSAWQGTLGKLAIGIRVTDMEGRRISLQRALLRYPAKFLSAFILCIGFLMVAWTQRKQGLHDMIVGTLVLNGRASQYQGHAQPSSRHDGSFSA